MGPLPVNPNGDEPVDIASDVREAPRMNKDVRDGSAGNVTRVDPGRCRVVN